MAKIVIGHRMGKGQNVAKGLESRGHDVFIIPGMLADMKLGDEMNKIQADFGISFCGSGGAGALNAKNKYGYKTIFGLRTILEVSQAIKLGNKVLGFGFMDSIELGEKIGDVINEKQS